LADCATCGTSLCRDNKSGLCRSCVWKDPSIAARRGEAIRRALMADPIKRERHRKAVTEANRSPERRARSGQQCRELRLWEKGLACMTPEVRARQGRSSSNSRLAHIPLERREEYLRLAKKYGAAEAQRIILDHHAAVLRRGRA